MHVVNQVLTLLPVQLLNTLPGQGEHLYKDAKETLTDMFLNPWAYQNGKFKVKKEG